MIEIRKLIIQAKVSEKQTTNKQPKPDANNDSKVAELVYRKIARENER